MRFRDRIYAAYDNVFLLSPVRAEVIDGLGPALIALLEDPLPHPVRTRWPSARGGNLRPAEFPAAVAASIHRLEPGLSDHALIAAAHRRGFAGLPVTVTVSGETVAVNLTHAVFDGAGAVETLQYLMTVASGGVGELDRRPLARFPLLRASSTLRPSGIRAYLANRSAARVDAGPTPVATPAQTALETARYSAFELVPALLADIRRGVQASPPKDGSKKGRASLNTRLASLAVDALRRSQSSGGDRQVTVAVDARRYVGDGRVEGNLSASLPFGALHGDGWSPSAITQRLAALGAIGAPVVFLDLALVRVLRGRITALLRRDATPAGSIGVSLSLVNAKPDLPPAIWKDGRGTLGCATIGPWPSATFVFVSTLGSSVRVSLWDETGDFAVDRFQAEFAAAVADRLPA